MKTLLLVEVGRHDVRRFTDGGRITLNNEEFEAAQSLADALLAAVEAGREYAERLELIYASPEYQGVFALAHAHGMGYRGMNDVEARGKLKAALAKYDAIAEKAKGE